MPLLSRAAIATPQKPFLARSKGRVVAVSIKPLRVDNLSFRYSDVPIFQDLSLTLEPGEIVILLGANGAGKTTLLRTIARQLRPESGTIWIDETDIHDFTRRALAQRVSLMPQFEHRETELLILCQEESGGG